MKDRCPFCWDKNVRLVGQVRGAKAGEGTKRMMLCPDCERWYWADSAEEIHELFTACETGALHPGKCCEEIRQVLNSGGHGFPRRRLAEFNFLCSECPDRKFAPVKIGGRGLEKFVVDSLRFGA